MKTVYYVAFIFIIATTVPNFKLVLKNVNKI
ncbi:hypothetical protein SAMN05720268_2434 [Polaribacter sp. KT 15]|nr:hypothetical protein SAMN05720268_2434 [Polaribacter sp. KT 15]